jgi:glucan-binding YG repeat protein
MQRAYAQRAFFKIALLSAILFLALLAPLHAFADQEEHNGANEQTSSVETASHIVTVPANVVLSVSNPTSLSASVSYDDQFVKGQTVRFTYNISGTTQPLQYRLYALELETADGWSQVVDVTRDHIGDYSSNAYFEESFYNAGKYRLTFQVMGKTGANDQYEFPRFQIEFTIAEDGDFKTIDTTVAQIVQQGNEACAAAGDSSDYARALWLHDWLIDNTEYDYSYRYCNAESVLGRGIGTCEGYHGAYMLLLNKAGIETRRVDDYGDTHVWTGVKLDGNWYNIDVTGDDSDPTPGIDLDVRHLYFALPSTIMQLVQTKWDGTYDIGYPNRADFDASSYEENYFIKSGEIDTYLSPYIDESDATYSIKAYLDAHKAEFAVPVVNDSWPPSFKNVIYNLVAHQLEVHDWGANTKISVGYFNDQLVCSATYNGTAPAKSLSNAIITNVVDLSYTSKPLEQKPKVVVDGKELVENSDYTLSYSNNIDVTTNKQDTHASVTITGKNGYFGSRTVNFHIKPTNISQGTIDYIKPQTYTGEKIEPSVTVRTGDAVLDPKNYTVTYKNNIDTGTATIVVTSTGDNCTGTKESTFIINQKALPTPSLSSSKIVYDGKAKEPVVVKDGTRVLEKDKDYTITYSNNVNVGTAHASLTGKGNYKGTQAIDFKIEQASSTAGGSNTGGSSSGTTSGGSSGSNASGGSSSSSSSSGSSSNIGTSGSSSGSNNNSSGSSSGSSSSPLNPAGNSSTISQSTPSAPTVTGTWKKSSGKWWFQYDAATKKAQNNKSYPTSEWVKIKGKLYHFDSKGWMNTKWMKLNNNWYYLGSDGAMKTGWQKVSGKWYFMENNGIMQTGKRSIASQTYYLDTESGAMKTGWNKESAGWFYYKSSGAMVKGWQKVKNKWYYLNPSDGVMKTGFYDVGGTRYYSNSSGAMLTGWQKISGNWYYFNKSGAMQKSTWISGTYWVGSDGIMATNAWVGTDVNHLYYVDGNGKWVKNAQLF